MHDVFQLYDDPNSYCPETVVTLDTLLEMACMDAAECVKVGDGLQQMLAAGLLEGIGRGMRSPEDLVRFALRCIPAFRIIDAARSS